MGKAAGLQATCRNEVKKLKAVKELASTDFFNFVFHFSKKGKDDAPKKFTAKFVSC